MTHSRRWRFALMLAALLLVPGGAAAQPIQIHFGQEDGNATVRVLQDYTLGPNETANHVVVIGGNARIEGHVYEDVVIVLGKVEVASTAVIDGSLVVSAGTVEVAEGAKVARDFVTIGGANVPASFHAGGQQVVIGGRGLGDGLRAMVPWLTRGLLLGRLIVPDLPWVWAIVGIFFFLNLLLNAMFDGPVRASAATLRATPFSAFMAGLLVMLLVGPVCVLLAISVVGIVVVPFVLCALLAAALIGRIGFTRWLGTRIFPQADPDDRLQSLRSFLIGSALITIAYLIPFIGIIVWTLAGVFGLGAATLAFYSSYHRENPRPPKKGVPPPAPPSESLVHDIAAAPAMPADLPLQDDERPLPPPEDRPAAPGPASYITPEVSVTTRGLLAFPKASFGERLAGLALDLVVVAIVVQLFGLDRHGDIGDRVTVVVALVYHVAFWTLRGTTLGGIICQLRVVRTDGRTLEFSDALIRGLTGIFSLVVAGLGFLWILRDPERQGWHDRVAGTYVVKVPRSVAA